MKILTAEEMGGADRRSVEAGVPVATLMQHAGEAVARFCLRRFGGDGLAVVLAGKGNNGGDGMVAAARLAEAGRPVRVALLGKASELKGEAAEAWGVATHLSDDDAGAKMGHPVSVEAREIADEAGLRAALEGAALVIDAVVGTGFKPPLRGLAAVAQGLLAESEVPVVAVDLPSGWDADSMEEKAAGAYRADAVVTFTAPKMAHVFGHLTGTTFGPVVVVGIGTPAEAIASANGLTWGGSAKRIAEAPRAINGNKGRLGHVLLVGGSYGKAGAPSMASVAAMRAGAGLVTAAVPREILPIVAAVAPELMLTPLEEQSSGSRVQGSGFEVGGLALDQLESEPLKALLKGISVVGIGPGLGQEGTTPEWVRTFVGRVMLPMVIDADALNALAGRTSMLKDATKKGRTVVLTPHPGEMARLVNMTVKEVEADRVGLARRFATEHGVTLVLKGWRTLVAHPDGRIAVNTTGNPSMAKGGSGDILTGIVSAMLAQYPENVADAVEAAVFLHGLAGDFACLAQDEHTVLATDTVEDLWQAFRARVKDADGLTWIAGTAAEWGDAMKGWVREKRLRTRSELGTLALGEMLTELLPAPKLVVLRGDLGMGKTTLVRGMAAALGADSKEVTSPTFTLVHEYQGRKTRLIHLDLYRLEEEREIEGIGLWEMAEAPDALVMVEWGDRFASVMERADAEISIGQGEAENERLLLVRW